MTKEALEKANALTTQVNGLKDHRSRVMQATVNLTKFHIGIQYSGGTQWFSLNPELFVIAADRQMQFYIDEIDKRITQLEAELAAL